MFSGKFFAYGRLPGRQGPEITPPAECSATGLLRRWDQETKTLLVWRVEHLLAWLAEQ